MADLVIDRIRKDIAGGATAADLSAKYTVEEMGAALSNFRQLQESTKSPGFFDRLASGFGTSPTGEAQILRERGVDAFTDEGGQVNFRTPTGTAPVDPSGFDVGDIADVAGFLPGRGGVAGAGPLESFDVGDIADVAGFLPQLAGEVMGGVGGVVAGAGAMSIPLGIAGAGAGGTLGHAARQLMAQSLGQKEEFSTMDALAEGAVAAGGEALAGPILKFLGGLFKGSAKAPSIQTLMGEIRQFDQAHGTQLEKLAPIDAKTSSDFMAGLTQRMRESSFGGQALREGQDIPFEREVGKGFDKLRESSGLSESGIGAGQEMKDAAASTLKARKAEQGALFDDFSRQVDPTAAPALDSTQRAVGEIGGSNVLKRKQTGSEGVQGLRTTLEEAGEITTFDELVTLRQAVGDKVNTFDPAVMSKGVNGQLRRLWTALKRDEEAFLNAGGTTSTAPRQLPEFNFAKSDATKQAPKVIEQSPNQIVMASGGLRKSEVARIRGAVPLERTRKASVGRLASPDGNTIEEMFEQVMSDDAGAAVFRAAGIETPDELFEAIRTGAFFKKYPAGGEQIDAALAGEQLEQARSGLGSIFDDINSARTIEDLERPQQRIQEALDSDIIGPDDASSFGDALRQRAETLTDDLAPLPLPPEAGIPGAQSRALQAGQRANRFSQDMFALNDASVQGGFKDPLKLADLPNKLPGMNADQIRAHRQIVGNAGTEGGLRTTAEGGDAWKKAASEVLETLRLNSRHAKSTSDHFVISGAKLRSSLEKFKPGALEEIFGPELADGLRRFADMVKESNVSERFGNTSGTAEANKLINDIGLFLRNPVQGAGRLVGRMAFEKTTSKLVGTQRGKAFLLGDLPFQQANPMSIQVIGRALGQGGIEAYRNDDR